MEFINFCDAKKILLAVYPPHSTHTLQPLNVGVFRPLAKAYNNKLMDFLDRCQGLCSITKRDFFRMFYKAWDTSLQEKTILKSFKTTGLSPFNPEAILSKFTRPASQNGLRPSSSTSSGSVISISDWRKLNAMVKEIVSDVFVSQSKKLTQAIYSAAVQSTLLQNENNRLREALINERRRRQRGKPLLFEKPAGYSGGAQFWSPNKVKGARELQAQKDAADKALQTHKDEQAKQKIENKLEKARLLEERKLVRAAEQEIRRQEKALKKAQIEENKLARQVDKQLQDDLKQSIKGRKNAPKKALSTPSIVVDEISTVVHEKPQPARSRRNRVVQLPQRFLE